MPLRRRQYAKDRTLGFAELPLHRLFQSEPVQTRDGALVHTVDAYVPFLSLDDRPATVAEVRVLLTLEDMGASDEVPVRPTGPGLTGLAQSSSGSEVGDSAESMEHGIEAPGRDHPPRTAVDRDSPQYQAAMEVEMWKKAEQEKFRLQLNAKEALLMKVGSCKSGGESCSGAKSFSLGGTPSALTLFLALAPSPWPASTPLPGSFRGVSEA